SWETRRITPPDRIIPVFLVRERSIAKCVGLSGLRLAKPFQTPGRHRRPIVARFVQGAACETDGGDVPESGQIMRVKSLARSRPGRAALRSSLTVLSESDWRRGQRCNQENPRGHHAIPLLRIRQSQLQVIGVRLGSYASGS